MPALGLTRLIEYAKCMNTSTRRWVTLDGTRNCRDLGGIPVAEGVTKFGVLYRSDALNLLSEADQQRLHDLNLAAIIDFRAAFEIDKAPNQLVPELAVKLKNRSFLPKSTHAMFDMVNNGEIDALGVQRYMRQQYRILTLEHTREYRQVLDDILAANGQALLYHCTSGKDRTGMISAIILAVLGAEDEAIIEDYTLTNGRIEPIAYLKASNDPSIVQHIMAADPQYMQTALQTMRSEFGSVDGYLTRALHLSTEEQTRLQQILID